MSAIIGRPPLIRNDESLEVHPTLAATRLQRKSTRRDVLNAMLEIGVPVTIEDLNQHFGRCVRTTVMALINAGWVRKVPETES